MITSLGKQSRVFYGKKRYDGNRETFFTLHAEFLAILKIKSDPRLKGAILVVVRKGGKEDKRMSKPCQHCANFIIKSGIKTVYYSV